ncbi:MAG: amine oxidase [Phycisphaerae bacterium]|nr:MAG: amine oxidase [Phycisphaerae bacterium]
MSEPTHQARGGPPRIVIIGAGPTGLGAGYRLKELGHDNFLILERHGYVGGLAHSFTDPAGFTWDIGGHVMFSHYSYYDRCFERLMGDEFTLNNRESWVRMFDRWVPYPFQNNVRYLPPEACYECLSGLIKAQAGKGTVPSPAAARNFGEFIDAVFGEGIARHFMRPYNFKVWAYPPERMNKEWIGERVAVIDTDRALRNVVLGKDDFGWGPNNQFKFPLKGGTGEFYRRFGPVLGLTKDGREQPGSHIRLNAAVASIDADAKVVTLADGHTEPYDHLLSTIPLDVLFAKVLRTRDASFPATARAASGLLHSAGYMVGLGLKSRVPGGGTPDTKSWMYFPEDNCPFYRVTYLSNYSPFMTPDKDHYYSLLCEVSESSAKPTPGANGQNPDAVIEDCVRGLENAGLLAPGERANIVSRWCYYADYSYPTPSVERDEILTRVIPWLEARGIASRGRFGMWKYEVANTDHSLMQGVEWVNRLLRGEPETTIGMTYTVTEDGRNAAVHERPAHAGSGEKRLKSPGPGAGVHVARDSHVNGGTKCDATRAHPAPVGDIPAGEVGEDEVGITGRS